MNKEKKLNFKDKLEIMEAVCTIIITVVSLWGIICAWESGLWHKVKYIIEFSHEKIVAEESKLKQEI